MSEETPNIEVARGVRHEPAGAAAGEGAAAEAMGALRFHAPSAVVVFASVRHDLEEVLRGVRGAVGAAPPVLGATTAGEICDGIHHGSVVVAILASPHLSVQVGAAAGVAAGWDEAASRALAAPGLSPYFDGTGSAWQRLAEEGKNAFALLVSPGATQENEGRSQEILELLNRRSLGRLPVFGLSAADDLRFEANYVLEGDRVLRDGVLVAVFETELRFGIALAHGMHPVGPPLTVTSSNGVEVAKLNGRPAADAYAEHMGLPRAALEQGYIPRYTRTLVGVPGPFGTWVPNAATFVTPGGGLRFAQPLAPGTVLTRLVAAPETVTAAGAEALQKAIARAGTIRPAAVIASYSVLRPLLLGDASEGEIPDMAGRLAGAPLVGFVSMGEQGPSDEGVSHHTNAVIGALVIGTELSRSAEVARENRELRRHAEEARRRTQESLEALVAERTALLQATNAQLQAEIEERRRHQRAWRTLSECNEAVMRATAERALFQDVCRLLVDVGGYRMAWVGLADDDRERAVRPVAHAGYEDGYLDEIRLVWSAEDPRGQGPVGTAIRTGEVVVVRDLASPGAHLAWTDQAVQRGYSSIVALPLACEGQTLGALAIYGTADHVLDEGELALLTDLANDLSFGLTALRVRIERGQMTAQLMQADRLVAMGTLATGVGHEINNPLSYVLSGVEALFELLAGDEATGPRLEEARVLLREVKVGLERIRQAVRDLKLFARGDDEVKHPVDVRSVLESTLHMAHNDIRHRARLVREYGGAPAVAGNESRLGQVFLNLIVNASQSIREGAAEENEIRVVTSRDAAGRAVIEIRDTGAGMSAEELSRIFEPFFTTKPVGVGTGLGLAICRNIVVSMGGDITAESERGKGSVFRVSLPGVEVGHLASAPPPDAPAPAHHARILVVDDDPLVARAIRRMLSREHEVTIETSSREALRRIEAGERFDMLLCDVMMPQMGGPALHAELGRIAPEQAARVVFITGGAFTAAASEYLERSGNRTLEKPFTPDELRRLLRDLG